MKGKAVDDYSTPTKTRPGGTRKCEAEALLVAPEPKALAEQGEGPPAGDGSTDLVPPPLAQEMTLMKLM